MWASRSEPPTFALSAELKPSGGGDARTVRCVSCRFVPVDEPVDVAAAALRLPCSARARFDDGPSSCYYFVLMQAHGGQDDEDSDGAAEL